MSPQGQGCAEDTHSHQAQEAYPNAGQNLTVCWRSTQSSNLVNYAGRNFNRTVDLDGCTGHGRKTSANFFTLLAITAETSPECLGSKTEQVALKRGNRIWCS